MHKTHGKGAEPFSFGRTILGSPLRVKGKRLENSGLRFTALSLQPSVTLIRRPLIVHFFRAPP